MTREGELALAACDTPGVGPFTRYSLYRFAILIGVFAVLYLFGARDWLLLLLTAAISIGLGYLLLARQRAAVTQDLMEKRQSNLTRRIEADNAAEDGAAEDGAAEDGDTAAGDTGGNLRRH